MTRLRTGYDGRDRLEPNVERRHAERQSMWGEPVFGCGAGRKSPHGASTVQSEQRNTGPCLTCPYILGRTASVTTEVTEVTEQRHGETVAGLAGLAGPSRS